MITFIDRAFLVYIGYFRDLIFFRWCGEALQISSNPPRTNIFQYFWLSRSRHINEQKYNHTFSIHEIIVWGTATKLYEKVMKHAKLQTVHPSIHPSIYLSVHPAYKQRKRTSKLFPYFQCFRYNCSKYYWPLFPILEFPVNIRKKQGQKCS